MEPMASDAATTGESFTDSTFSVLSIGVAGSEVLSRTSTLVAKL